MKELAINLATACRSKKQDMVYNLEYPDRHVIRGHSISAAKNLLPAHASLKLSVTNTSGQTRLEIQNVKNHTHGTLRGADARKLLVPICSGSSEGARLKTPLILQLIFYFKFCAFIDFHDTTDITFTSYKSYPCRARRKLRKISKSP